MLPKIMGSSYATDTGGATPKATPRTNAARYGRRHNPYAQFGDHDSTEFEMTRWDGQEAGPEGVPKSGTRTVVITGDPGKHTSDDDSSEKGIVETRSVMIERN